MPIYEYQCTSSGERFEVKQKISDPPIKTCDQLSCSCREGQPVTKMISAPAIMFKGTGWYVTDYSDKLKEPSNKSENKGQPAETQSDKNKTDGKTTDHKTSESAPAPSSSSNAASGNTGTSSTSGGGSNSSSSAPAGSNAGTAKPSGKNS